MFRGLTVQGVAKRLNQEVQDPRKLSFAAVDSRKCEENSLFVALLGENVDGHDYLQKASEKGAIAAIVRSDYTGDDFGMTLIKVDDTLMALQEVARVLMREFNPFVVAMTGSVGKTTIKEFVFTLVKEKYKVSKTFSSYNGQIGLPLSILNAEEDSEMLILEMGISKPFEMDTLVSIAPPQIAILGRVADAHIGHFDSKEHLASEKAKIFDSKHLRMGFLHTNNLVYSSIKNNHTFKKYTYGSELSDYYLKARNEHVDIFDKVKEEKISLSLPFCESHFIENFLVAAIVANYLNVSWETIKKRAQLLKPFNHRFEKHKKQNVLYIDDTYNCNPTNLECGLKNIPRPGSNNKVIAVIGEMRELGASSQESHERLGEFATDFVDELICFGEESYPMYATFKNIKQSAHHSLDKNEIYELLKSKIKPGDVVYMKGGNANKLWEILDKLLEKA